MKPTGQRWRLDRNNYHQLNGLIEHIKLKWVAGKDVTLQFMDGERTTNQNSMIYALYGDIARQAQDLTVNDVKAQCKLHYGVPILRAHNPAFRQMWDEQMLGDKASYEAKLALMDYLDVTKKFTKEQASEYIDTIIQNYTQRGYSLVDPRT